MRRILAVVAVTTHAHADGALDVHGRAEATDHAPYLELDPVLTTQLRGLGGIEDATRTTFSVGDVRGVVEGMWHENADGALPVLDLETRGWHAGVRLTRAFGRFRIGVGASLDDIDTRFGAGRYYDLGASLTRTFRLSRKRTAWLTLGVGRRTWLGDEPPPAGEADVFQVMLGFGLTF